MGFDAAIGIRFQATDVWASMVTIGATTAGAVATGALINTIPVLKNNLGLVDLKTAFLAGNIFAQVFETWRGMFIRSENARKEPPLIAHLGIIPAGIAAFLTTKAFDVPFNNPLVGLITLVGGIAGGWIARRFHDIEIDAAIGLHGKNKKPTQPHTEGASGL